MFDDAQETVFIGDIHGHAPTLLALLDGLGWTQRNGRLSGPAGQRLVFVGDLIDRGPQNLRTVEVVRELVEDGQAICLMGNHEFNAVQFHTEHPRSSGEHLREQSPKNIRQHEAVLKELEQRPGDKADMLAWFKTLPIAVEGPGWRCVHACWHPGSLTQLAHAAGFWHLPADRWVAASNEDELEYRAIETLLKGPELKLPGKAYFLDKSGIQRHHARIRWWEPMPETLDDALLFQKGLIGLDPSSEPYRNSDHPAYPDDAPPVFFGHYWNTGEPRPERHNAACLDYSIGKGGQLVAYRHSGSRVIESRSFMVQDRVR